MKTLKQTKKIGVSGSFFNQMMGNNSSIPEVDQWATIMHYTDRSVAKVVEVSKDFKTVKIQYYNAVATQKGIEMGIGHQDWEFEPSERFLTLRYRNNGWKICGKEIVFTDQFKKEHEDCFLLAKALTPEQKEAVYAGEVHPQNVVEGITMERKTYRKISIIFGVCNYYHDWSF